ncbi:MAG: FMN-binding protein [Oscillospiraceae bacterium]
MKKTRKFIAPLLTLAALLSLSACGGPAKQAAVYVPGVYTEKVIGYEGLITVSVTVDEYAIVSVEAEHKETPDKGGAAIEQMSPAFVEANSAEIDGVSGATTTSTVLKEAVSAALEAASVK